MLEPPSGEGHRSGHTEDTHPSPSSGKSGVSSPEDRGLAGRSCRTDVHSWMGCAGGMCSLMADVILVTAVRADVVWVGSSPHHRRCTGPILGGSCMDTQSAQPRARAQLLPSTMKGLLPGQTLQPTLPLSFSLVQFGAQFLTESFL